MFKVLDLETKHNIQSLTVTMFMDQVQEYRRKLTLVVEDLVITQVTLTSSLVVVEAFRETKEIMYEHQGLTAIIMLVTIQVVHVLQTKR